MNFILGTSLIFTAVVVALLCLPLLFKKVERNRFYGMRFQKSLESDELWYKINRYGSCLFLLWSVILGVIGTVIFFLPPIHNPVHAILLSLTPLVYIIAATQTYLYARKL